MNRCRRHRLTGVGPTTSRFRRRVPLRESAQGAESVVLRLVTGVLQCISAQKSDSTDPPLVDGVRPLDSASWAGPRPLFVHDRSGAQLEP